MPQAGLGVANSFDAHFVGSSPADRLTGGMDRANTFPLLSGDVADGEANVLRLGATDLEVALIDRLVFFPNTGLVVADSISKVSWEVSTSVLIVEVGPRDVLLPPAGIEVADGVLHVSWLFAAGPELGVFEHFELNPFAFKANGIVVFFGSGTITVFDGEAFGRSVNLAWLEISLLNDLVKLVILDEFIDLSLELSILVSFNLDSRSGAHDKREQESAFVHLQLLFLLL